MVALTKFLETADSSGRTVAAGTPCLVGDTRSGRFSTSYGGVTDWSLSVSLLTEGGMPPQVALGVSVDFLQLWLVVSISFSAGWVVRSALVNRRAEEPSIPLQRVDVRVTSKSERSSRARSSVSARPTQTALRRTINLN